MSDNDPKPPTPEEISRKLAEFMKSNFGGAVSFNAFPGGVSPFESEPASGAEPPLETDSEEPEYTDIYSFNYRPKDIKAHLDRFVIRQDEAKKVLSIAVCDHYNHAKFLRSLAKEDPERAAAVEFTKQNVIIVGPTGVGKTYLVKHIADLIGVPFVKADATKFSETGYVGGDVDDLVRDLVRKADGDVELAEHGIIYIDEIDKLASQGGAMGRDVSGRGVQTTLLKLMEETEVSVRNPMDMQSQMMAMFEMQRGGGRKPQRSTINTRHILFIVSGAFSGLEKHVGKRLRSGTIGFGAEAKEMLTDEDMFRRSTTQDFIDYGFEAEFIGRLPVRVVCEKLGAPELLEIMRESEGSVLRQYEREFSAYGISARFEDAALEWIAEKAADEGTGARGLLTVCERLLREFKFELPGTSISELLIDGDLVKDPASVLKVYAEKGREVNTEKVAAEIEVFVREMKERDGVGLVFDPAAIASIGVLSVERNMSAMQLCQQLFHDYQFGLKLIQKNTGQKEFPITPEAVRDPDAFISELVVGSYRKAPVPGDAPPAAENETP
jgi:ATP-dependent Clp protease ATP-binding subunit ClpX